MTSPNTTQGYCMRAEHATRQERSLAARGRAPGIRSRDASGPYRPLRDPLRFIGVPSRYITRSMKYCPSESVRDSWM